MNNRVHICAAKLEQQWFPKALCHLSKKGCAMPVWMCRRVTRPLGEKGVMMACCLDGWQHKWEAGGWACEHACRGYAVILDCSYDVMCPFMRG